MYWKDSVKEGAKEEEEDCLRLFSFTAERRKETEQGIRRWKRVGRRWLNRRVCLSCWGSVANSMFWERRRRDDAKCTFDREREQEAEERQ